MKHFEDRGEQVQLNLQCADIHRVVSRRAVVIQSALGVRSPSSSFRHDLCLWQTLLETEMCAGLCRLALRASVFPLCSLFHRCGSAPARRLAFPSRQEEADTLHQGPAQRTGKRVRGKQIHHQGQEEEDLRRHQPFGAANHHLVPEQEGEGEEVRGQSEDQRAVTRNFLRIERFSEGIWRSLLACCIENELWEIIKIFDAVLLTDWDCMRTRVRQQREEKDKLKFQ